MQELQELNPDFTELSQLKNNLYKETCPIIIETGVLLFDQERDCVYARLSMRNISDRVITSVLLDIHVFDLANNEIEVLRDHQYFGLSAPRDAIFGGDTDISIISNTGKTISVAVRRVTFSDDTTWEGSASLFYESIPPRKTVLEELEDQESADQYARDFAAEMAKDQNARAVYVPDDYKDLWLCACGGINHAEEEECHLCGAQYEPQKIHINNRVQIAANLTEYRKLQAERAEQARLEAERKAAEAAAAKAEAERLAEEERIRKEKEAARRARMKKIAICISIPTVIAIILFLIVLVTYLIPSGKYAEGKQLMEAGSYDEALATFSALNGFGDSETQILEAKYQKALALSEKKSYNEAIALFKELEEYSDAADQINSAKYQMALTLSQEGKYEEAVLLFDEASDFPDAADQASACRLKLAQKALEGGDLKTAAELFEKLNKKDSLAMQQVFCDKGTALYNAGEESSALEYFALVTDQGLLQQINSVYYAGAMKLIDGGDYDKAAEILKKLGEYEDSASQLLRIDYLKAASLFQAGSYEEAKALYTSASGYEDADTMAQECDYQLALRALSEGSYEDAQAKFEALGSYKDSASMVTETIYQHGSALLNNGSVLDAYYTLYAIKDYAPAYALLVSNSQFYIHVYDVGVGPNPLDE